MAAHPLHRPRCCSSVGLVNAGEIEHAVTGAVAVTPSLVFQAKAYLVAHASGNTTQMVDAFVAEMGATLIQPVVIHPSADHDAIVRAVARWISCQTAAREAVWALIGSGALVPRSDRMDQPGLDVQWSTVVPGSGGSSSGWRFGDAIPIPALVSLASAGATHLTDGDLYLASLDLPDLDDKVAESLREAVACFRHDLFTPAQVMLGRAAEGCWTLLGEALVLAAPGETAAQAVGRELGRGLHFAHLPERVATLYTNSAYAGVVAASGVSHADLRGIRVWTDALREARNAVHHAADAPLPATWETTAVLLMGAVPNLRGLWVATAAARLRAAGGAMRTADDG
jgi:hypothetical protein